MQKKNLQNNANLHTEHTEKTRTKTSIRYAKENDREKREKIRRNYDTKLSGEIMTRNYELVYYVAPNVGIIGILAYPKI